MNTLGASVVVAEQHDHILAQQTSCHIHILHSHILHSIHADPGGFCVCSLRHGHNYIQARHQRISCHIHVQYCIRRCTGRGCIHIHGQPGRHRQKQHHIHDHSHIQVQPQQISYHIHDIHPHHEAPEDSCVCSYCHGYGA